MGTSNADRQRQWRERAKDSRERIDILASVHAKRALERLSWHWGCTQTQALERALIDTQDAILSRLDGADQDRFYDMRPLHGNG